MVLPRYMPIIGGAEVQCRRLINQFKKNKDVDVVSVVTRRIEPTLLKNDKVDEVNVKRLPPGGTGVFSEYVFCFVLFMYLLINKHKYNVIHCHASSIFGITCSLLGALLNKRVIVKISTNGEIKSMQNTKFKKRITQIASKYCTYIALNQEGYEEVRKHIKNANVQLIPNGIDFTNDHMNDFLEGQTIRNSLYEKYGNDILISVFVGRFVTRKGINELYQTAKRFDKVIFLLVGAAELQRDAISLDGSQMNNILVIGRKDNVFPYLLAADLFISPSHQEGLPNTVIEALSVGRKCLLSDIWPHRELWEEHNENINLFKVGSVDSMSHELENLSDIRGEEVYKRDINKLLGKYSIENVANIYSHLYKDMLNAVC